MFGYTEPDDKVVQTARLKEEIAVAQKRLDEIGEDSDKVSSDAKAAVKEEIEEAEKNLENIPQGTTALGFMKMRVGLQKTVEGARDNAITSTKAERYDGMVSVSYTHLFCRRRSLCIQEQKLSVISTWCGIMQQIG